jgi:hypothetical protein
VKFRERPAVIDAALWDGVHIEPVQALDPGKFFSADGRGHLMFRVPGSSVTAAPGDWIVKTITGEFSAVKPDLFAVAYEAVGESEEDDLTATLTAAVTQLVAALRAAVKGP